MTLVALGLLLGMVGLLWVMVIDIMQADHCAQTQRSYDLDKPVAEAIRRAGCRHSRSGTIDRVSNQKKGVPEAPRFLHHFYFLCVTLNADK